MSCVRRTEKKYLVRPGPPYSAQECPSMLQIGNDGKVYQSLPNAKGIFQWKPLGQKRSPSPQEDSKIRAEKMRMYGTTRMMRRSKKASRKRSTSSSKKRSSTSSRKRSTSSKRRRDVKGLCKRRLQKKIEKNIKEYEAGRYVSRAQAAAVSYSQVNKEFKECRKYYVNKGDV